MGERPIADSDVNNVVFRFGAVSDTHNNRPNVERMNQWGKLSDSIQF
jgi:hypothetical protein